MNHIDKFCHVTETTVSVDAIFYTFYVTTFFGVRA